MRGRCVSGTLVRLELHHRKSGGPRHIRVYRCSSCGVNEVKRRGRERLVDEPPLLCGSCVHQKRPFESIYQGLFKDHRRTKVDLSYEEYLAFTRVPECHYCGGSIPWQPFGTVNGEFKSRAYFLDRKDCSGPYSASNCVVCCTECNKLRSARFTYEEFLELSPGLRSIRNKRKQA